MSRRSGVRDTVTFTGRHCIAEPETSRVRILRPHCRSPQVRFGSDDADSAVGNGISSLKTGGHPAGWPPARVQPYHWAMNPEHRLTVSC